MATQDKPIELAPELKPIGEQLLRTMQLAMEKAVAHAHDPKKYPMPTARGSLESALLTRLRQLPKERQEQAIKKVMADVTAPARTRGQRYGDLAKVDLASAAPVTDQADKHAARIKLAPEKLIEINRRGKPAPDTGDGAVDLK